MKQNNFFLKTVLLLLALVTGVNAAWTTEIPLTVGNYLTTSDATTTGTINMEMFHMMSDVTINLTTTSGGDKVTLAGATIKLTNTYPTGKVLMGNGLVIPTGTVDDVTETVNESYKVENYGFVPQDLTSVVLTITTTDNNQYRKETHKMSIMEKKRIDHIVVALGKNPKSISYSSAEGCLKILRMSEDAGFTR